MEETKDYFEKIGIKVIDTINYGKETMVSYLIRQVKPTIHLCLMDWLMIGEAGEKIIV